ncbi:D-glycero-beta-D-manno-heptose-7-phosphate kinase [candidate division WOR-3 bacterium]|nr:D-glycero-beta-D-manno-heptose-7-phosphate kinase [candidate division WOR-3 bacterium]
MRKDKAIAILNNIKNKKILVVGDVMLDEYLWGRVERISPEAPVPVVKIEKQSCSLGGAGNVAFNAHSLGAKPLLLGIAGSDAAGETLKSLLKEEGMNDKGIFILKGRSTIVKKRVVAHHQQVVRVDIEETFSIDREIEDRIITYLRRIERNLAAIIIEDYNKGLLTKSLIQRIIDFAKKRNLPITVDPKFEHFFDYESVTLFKPNIRELERVSGKSLIHINEIVKTLRWLQKKIKAEAILLTMGERGMVLIEKGKKPYFLKPHALDVYDVTGAGDTVIAAMTLAMTAGYNMHEATKFASVTAAIEVTKLGAAPVTPDEIIRFCDMQ